MDDEVEWWNAKRCADYWGVQVSTWVSYYNKNYTGLQDAVETIYDSVTGKRLYRADQVQGWKRPGQGTRTDLMRLREVVDQLGPQGDRVE